jgi:hypothetical protein
LAVTVEQVADAMYDMVKEYAGRKQFTARELTKTVMKQFGDECTRSLCRDAVKHLMDSGRCVYTYKGTSYVELAERQEIDKPDANV